MSWGGRKNSFDASYNVALLVDSEKSELAKVGNFLQEVSRLNFDLSKHRQSVAITTDRLIAAIPGDRPLPIRPKVKRNSSELIRMALEETTP